MQNGADRNMIFNEYKFLRDEIMMLFQIRNTLTTFTITTVIVILALSVNIENYLVALLPFLIIVPICLRTIYYGYAMMKLAAYIVVFLEPKLPEIQWETRNAITMPHIRKMKGETLYNISTTIRYHEFTILSFMTSVTFYFISYISDSMLLNWYNPINMLPIVITIFIFIATIYGRKSERIKQFYVDNYMKLSTNFDA
ncbi:MAG: hypothetical protein FWC92_02345 [Defluviitaleaceae bacterium]|nr:hypothetical protein [Defluviitaleaceae bacterium]